MQLTHSPHSPQPVAIEPLRRRTHDHFLPVFGMFALYVLPFSAIAPFMLYYAGTHYNVTLLSALNANQLTFISEVFFATELAMTFIMAGFIQWLGNATLKIARTRYEPLNPPAADTSSSLTSPHRHRVSFHEAYTLAALAPTPLWLASFALFIPNFAAVAIIGVIGLSLSMYILYAATPAILKIENPGEAALMGWVYLSAGMVGWAAMMYLTFITWAYITGRSFM